MLVEIINPPLRRPARLFLDLPQLSQNSRVLVPVAHQLAGNPETPPINSLSRPKAPGRSVSKSQPSASATTKSTRIPHNLIERRYRRKLQDQLDHLATKIPGCGTGSPRGLDVEDADFAIHRRSKASAMAAAAKHIDDLERDIAKKDNFVKALQEQIQGLQKLVNCDDCSIVRCLQANARNPSSDFLREYDSAGIQAS